MAKWRAGQVLPVEAWDRDMKKKLAVGNLPTIDSTIDPSTGTARFKADPRPPSGALLLPLYMW